MISQSWLPAVPMERIVLHWTGGPHTPNSHDMRAYHFLIDGNGKWHRGVPLERNSGRIRDGYAAHTLNCNSGSIGVSICCMASAVESPFDPGRFPMRAEQVDALVTGVRLLAERYRIPISRRTILSHAEVEPTLMIKQRQKWDYKRVPFQPELRGAIRIGDWLRKRIRNAPGGDIIDEPVPAGGIGIVTSPTLSARAGPSASAPATGELPKGTRVVVVGQELPWLKVQTPAGYVVWVHGGHVKIIDGPPEDGDEPGDLAAEAPAEVPADVFGTGIVTSPTLSARAGPSASAPATGELPKGTRVVVVGQELPWLKVQTPAGYVVWVHGGHVKIIDGPPEDGDEPGDLAAEAPAEVPADVFGTGIVTSPTLSARAGPSATAPATGELPKGTRVVVVGQELPWLKVRTPAGYVVWVHGGHVKMLDGSPEGEDERGQGPGEVPGNVPVEVVPAPLTLEERIAVVEARLARLEGS